MLAILFGLTLLTLVAYLPSLRNGFVGFDDPQYVQENPHVRGGLSWPGLRWALTARVADHWHPLTLLSLMSDAQLYGLDPRGFHLTNLVLHLAATLLLFGVLHAITGAPWRSAACAALFAVHPIHVESVAWIAERKDVLSAFFWMLTLAAYLHYTRRPAPARYLLVAAAFIAALMAKSSAVALPCILLLLDVWPLARLPLRGRLFGVPPAAPAGSDSRAILWRRVIEKLPLLAAAGATAVIAVIGAQRQLQSSADASLVLRSSNAATSYVAYLGKLVYPAHLGVFYPFLPVPLGRGLAAAAGILLVTWLAARFAAWAPYLLVGWLWYLVALLPAIGIVQAGWQGMADRYTYVPSIGLSLAAVWGIADLLERLERGQPARRRQWTRRTAQAAVAALGLTTLLLLTAMTRRQLRTWFNTLTLFDQALAVAPSYIAHTNVAFELQQRGDAAGALAHYRAAAALAPRNPLALAALGNALRTGGRPAAALGPLTAALALDPADERARMSLAMALDDLGRPAEAVVELRRAAAAHPGSLAAHQGLSVLLERLGDSAGAARERQLAAAISASATGAAATGSQPAP